MSCCQQILVFNYHGRFSRLKQVCDAGDDPALELLGESEAPMYFPQQKCDETMTRVRECAKQTQ